MVEDVEITIRGAAGATVRAAFAEFEFEVSRSGRRDAAPGRPSRPGRVARRARAHARPRRRDHRSSIPRDLSEGCTSWTLPMTTTPETPAIGRARLRRREMVRANPRRRVRSSDGCRSLSRLRSPRPLHHRHVSSRSTITAGPKSTTRSRNRPIHAANVTNSPAPTSQAFGRPPCPGRPERTGRHHPARPGHGIDLGW